MGLWPALPCGVTCLCSEGKVRDVEAVGEAGAGATSRSSCAFR